MIGQSLSLQNTTNDYTTTFWYRCFAFQYLIVLLSSVSFNLLIISWISFALDIEWTKQRFYWASIPFHTATPLQESQEFTRFYYLPITNIKCGFLEYLVCRYFVTSRKLPAFKAQLNLPWTNCIEKRHQQATIATNL